MVRDLQVKLPGFRPSRNADAHRWWDRGDAIFDCILDKRLQDQRRHHRTAKRLRHRKFDLEILVSQLLELEIGSLQFDLGRQRSAVDSRSPAASRRSPAVSNTYVEQLNVRQQVSSSGRSSSGDSLRRRVETRKVLRVLEAGQLWAMYGPLSVLSEHARCSDPGQPSRKVEVEQITLPHAQRQLKPGLY